MSDFYSNPYESAIPRLRAIGEKLTAALAAALARQAMPARETLPIELRAQPDQLASLTAALARS